MNVLQLLVYWMARAVGLLPPVSSALIQQARLVIKDVELNHRAELHEYRRHLAMKRLVEGGADARAAALAIEIAVHKDLR